MYHNVKLETGNCVFSQHFHTRKLGDITVFYAVFFSERELKNTPFEVLGTMHSNQITVNAETKKTYMQWKKVIYQTYLHIPEKDFLISNVRELYSFHLHQTSVAWLLLCITLNYNNDANKRQKRKDQIFTNASWQK